MRRQGGASLRSRVDHPIAFGNRPEIRMHPVDCKCFSESVGEGIIRVKENELKKSMPAVDSCEPQMIRALEKAGWTIAKQHYPIRLGKSKGIVYADLLIERKFDDVTDLALWINQNKSAYSARIPRPLLPEYLFTYP